MFAPGYSIAAVIANEFTEATGDLYQGALIELGLVLFALTIVINGVARILVVSTTKKRRLRNDVEQGSAERPSTFDAHPHRVVHIVRGGHAGLHPGLSVRARRQQPELEFLYQTADAGGRNRRRHGQRDRGQRQAAAAGHAASACPIGFLGGVYLAEFGGSAFSFVVRYITDLLNGVPSIVIGIFAYTLIVVPQKHFSTLGGRPRAGRDDDPDRRPQLGGIPARRAARLREGAMALGASKAKAIFTVVIPAAKDGIITGIMLNLARVAGETAPLLFTSFRQPFWSPGWEQPTAASAGDDLYLCHRAVRGLAPAGLGRRFCFAGAGFGSKYRRAADPRQESSCAR